MDYTKKGDTMKLSNFFKFPKTQYSTIKGDNMKTFIPVYKMKSSNFFKFPKTQYPTIEEVLISDDYVVLPEIKAKDLEEAYITLNLNHPDDFIYKINELASIENSCELFPTLHSSLSVEDILIEVIDEFELKYHYCDNSGWKELTD